MSSSASRKLVPQTDRVQELDISETPESASTSSLEFKDVFERFFSMMKEARKATSREGLIERFFKKRAEMDTMQARRNRGMYLCLSSSDAKPKSKIRRSLDGLSPMLISDLKVGVTHRGHYLCGRVGIADAFFAIMSGTFLLEDIAGDLVEIAVYELQEHQVSQISRFFPVGRTIAIIEPYYKRRTDFTFGIRVDEPREIVSWSLPMTTGAWKDLGNEFMHRVPQHGQGALLCYEAALKEVTSTSFSLLQSLLTNLSICRHSFGEYMEAVRLAAMAFVIDPSVLKPKYLLSKSLLALGKSCSRMHPAIHVAEAIIASTMSSSDLTQAEAKQFEEFIEPLKASTNADCRRYGSHRDIRNCFQVFPAEYSWCMLPEFVDWEVFGPDAGINIGSQKKMVIARESKEKGSKLFREGKTEQAQDCYLQAVYNSKDSSKLKDVAAILSNKGAALLVYSNEAEELEKRSYLLSTALANCCVSALFDHSNWKPWVRQVHIAEKLLGRGTAKRWCDRLLQILCTQKETPSVRKIVEELSGKKESLTVGKRVNDSNNSVYREPETKQGEAHGPTLSPAGAAHFDEENYSKSLHTAMSAFTLGKRLIESDRRAQIRFGKLLKRPCPKIHEELLREHGIPSGIDPQTAIQILKVAAHEARNEPWFSSHMMLNNLFPFNLQMKIKRWNGPFAFQRVEQSEQLMKAGDVIDLRMEKVQHGFSYPSMIRSNFGNAPSAGETMFYGATHVSIGFNDLGSLLCAKFSRLETDECIKQAVRFVGFEKSEFSVAKSRVVAQMIGDPTIPLIHVLQVWYSSTWSEDTLISFRRAVSKAVTEYKEFLSPSEKVIESYHQHWMRATPVSVASARQTFMKNIHTHGRQNLSNICSFRRLKDRLALCHYFLTGEVLPSDLAVEAHERYMATETSGCQENPLRQGTSEGRTQGQESADSANWRGRSTRGGRARRKGRSRSGKAKHVESIAQRTVQEERGSAWAAAFGSVTAWSVPAGSPVVEECNAFGGVAAREWVAELEAQGGDMNMMDLFVVRTLRKLHELRKRMMEKRVTVELYAGVVDALATRQSIEMAQKIGALKPKTVSWSNVLDYMELGAFHEVARVCSDGRDTIHYGYSMNWVAETYGANIMDYDVSTEKGRRVVSSAMEKALGRQAIERAKKIGLELFLFVPLFETQLNLCGYELAQKMHGCWVKHFCSKAMGDGAGVRSIRMVEYHTSDQFPLYRSDLNVYMKWTYI